MKLQKHFSFFLLLGTVLCANALLYAQTGNFRARLSPLPVTPLTVNTITGGGQVTASLSNNVLSLNGTFNGLSSVATVAHVHSAPKAMRGPPVHALEVSTDKSGSLTGRIELTPEQVTALQAEALYIQIHSETNPEGEIRGWLLIQR
jgi:hypothetical protein